MISIGPAKIVIVLVVALIVLGPEKLPQMTRQIGRAWGDFRRFRENLEAEVKGALGDDLNDLREPFTTPWSTGRDSGAEAGATQDGTNPDWAVHDATADDATGSDRAPPPDPGLPSPVPPARGTTRSAGPAGLDPGIPPDDPSLN